MSTWPFVQLPFVTDIRVKDAKSNEVFCTMNSLPRDSQRVHVDLLYRRYNWFFCYKMI